MADLSRIRKGRRKLAPRILIYSFDGVGKTGFAAGAPDVFFVDANKGSHQYDVQSVDVSSWEETRDYVEDVASDKIKCGALALDAITDLEAFSHAKLFPGSTVTKYEGGYGKGDDVVTAEWRTLLSRLEKIWLSGKPIIMAAHAKVKKFEDPTGPGYERFEVACRPQLAGLLRQWVDYVLFCKEELVIAKQKGEAQRGTTTGIRYMYTRRCPAYDAKARGTLLFPERILLSWRDFIAEVEKDASREGTAGMERSIREMLEEISDPALDEQVWDYVKKYPAGIVDAYNRVAAKLDEARKKKEDK